MSGFCYKFCSDCNKFDDTSNNLQNTLSHNFSMNEILFLLLLWLFCQPKGLLYQAYSYYSFQCQTVLALY